ncbi:MAG TPA: iron-sulfur cluster repair di-iron protein [Chitinophagaceae bacterium]|jgi:regulator of cell morphogenesis and NO signaling
MNSGLSSKTLAQIVTENYKAAYIFERYDLDFCCKGKRSLQIACDEKGLSVETITSELNVSDKNESPVVDFDKLSLAELADYIVSTHHSYAKNEMPQIFAYLHKVAFKHGDRHNELKTIFEKFSELKDEMETHMRKEEFVLFPKIKDLEKKIQDHAQTGLRIRIPIMVMEDEHEYAGALLKEIRNLSNDYNPPADACTTYRLCFAALQAFEIDLHQHIHLENNILFPKAMNLSETEILPGDSCSCNL